MLAGFVPKVTWTAVATLLSNSISSVFGNKFRDACMGRPRSYGFLDKFVNAQEVEICGGLLTKFPVLAILFSFVAKSFSHSSKSNTELAEPKTGSGSKPGSQGGQSQDYLTECLMIAGTT